MSRARYQEGSLIQRRRADGKVWWILRYRVTDLNGKRVQRQFEIGSTDDYKSESAARRAADGMRQQINNEAPAVQLTTVAFLADHFKRYELREDDERLSWSTKSNYLENIDGWILPRWGGYRLMDVKSVAVEEWLGTLLHRKTGKPLENPTKQRIRNILSVMFTHAQRHEFAPMNHNPIKFVRQSGKRSKIPDILEPGEVRDLWAGSEPREAAAIAVNFGNALRRGEGFALKWSDVDWQDSTAMVERSIVKGRLGKVKTEVSKKRVPLHAYQVESLLAWRAVSPYPEDHDWVFASHTKGGKMPMWPDMILRHHIKPLAKKLGITKNIGWHTFRRTFSTLLTANDEDVKTVQELLRHSNPQTTLLLYSQGVPKKLRKAQKKVIEMVRKPAVSKAKKGSNFICAPIVPQQAKMLSAKTKVSTL